MRQGIGPLNRTWLAIIGILLLLAGGAALLFATGLATRIGQAAGLPAELAPPSQRVIGGDLETIIQPTVIAAGAAITGVILAVLALLWLLKQIPRKNQARTLRLHADGAEGLTLCRPQVITDAVEDDIKTFPGVMKGEALLRGTASEPDLTVHATVGDRADIRDLIDYICERIAADVETALEVRLHRLAILLDVSAGSKASKTIIL